MDGFRRSTASYIVVVVFVSALVVDHRSYPLQHLFVRSVSAKAARCLRPLHEQLGRDTQNPSRVKSAMVNGHGIALLGEASPEDADHKPLMEYDDGLNLKGTATPGGVSMHLATKRDSHSGGLGE
jgi:hypothetical protein